MAFLWRAKGEQFFDNSGNPLNGGKLAYFDAGTTSAKTVYQDSDEQTPWGSIVLDSSGRLEYSVYIGSGAFKERLRTSADVDIYTEDDIPGETVLTTSSFARPNMPVLSKSLSYTVLQDDIGSMIQADPTGGDVTITLISAVTAGDGAQIGVQHVGSAGKVIVAVPGGQTVNGASTVTIRVPRSGAVFTSNAGVWSGPVTSAPFATLSKTTTYTVGVVDHGKTILASATGGAFTITLPAVSDAGDGFEITVVKTDSSTNLVTVDGDGSETINGSANTTLSLQWQSATIRCDGTNWQIVSAATQPEFQSATDNSVPRMDGTRGKMQSSSVIIDDSNNVSGVGTLGVSGQITSSNTGADKLASGTTAQRPSGTAGMLRYNSTLSRMEFYDGSSWRTLLRQVWDFTSGETSIPAGTDTSTIAHGLGAVPTRLRVVLRCKTTDLGWAVGDEVDVTSYIAPGTAAVNSGADATNVYVGSTSTISIYNRSSPGTSSITKSSWRIVVYASL